MYRLKTEDIYRLDLWTKEQLHLMRYKMCQRLRRNSLCSRFDGDVSKFDERGLRLMKITVVDLFCGIGGLTHALELAGLNVVAGYGIDPTCKFAYEENNKMKFGSFFC